MPAAGAAPRNVAGLRHLASAAFTLDVRSLAAYRIGLGLLLVADAILRTRDFRLMFAPDGIFPPALIRQLHSGPFAWSLAFLDDSLGCGAAVLAAQGVAGACLAAGFHTRAATIVGWIALVSVVRRTAPATNAGDMWLTCQLLWSTMLPLGAAWSIDARRRQPAATARPAAVCSLASAALVLQLVAVYEAAGISKCNDTWFSGDAVRHALSVHDHGTALGMTVARADWLTRPLTWAVVAGELLAPAILLVAPTAAVRGGLVAAFVAFHALIWITMSVGLFAPIGIVAWLPLIPARAWSRLGGPLPGTTAGLERWTSAACATAMGLAAASFLHDVGSWRSTPLPAPLVAAIDAACLRQEWGMFGMVPAQHQWVYGAARLADGRTVDLLRNGRPVEREFPAGGFTSLPHHRWHKLFWILPRPPMAAFRPAVAAALAGDWNSRHEGDDRAVAVEIVFAQRATAGDDSPTLASVVASWPPRSADGRGNLDRLLQDLERPLRPPLAGERLAEDSGR